MAGYRQFHTKFWKDEWLIDLDPLERYLFVYLFTNDLSSISGIYKLPFKVILNETGLDKDFVDSTLAKFQQAEKIFYQEGVMWVVNMRDYHKNASPRTMKKVNDDVASIPDGAVKRSYIYHVKTGIYSIDTVSIPNTEIKSVSESINENKSESANTGGDAVDDLSWVVAEQPEPQFDADFGLLVTAYENNFGMVTQMLSEQMADDLKEYGLSNCLDAIGESLKQNVRKWAYVQGILKRRKVDGLINNPHQLKESKTKGPVKIVLSDGSVVEAQA